MDKKQEPKKKANKKGKVVLTLLPSGPTDEEIDEFVNYLLEQARGKKVKKMDTLIEVLEALVAKTFKPGEVIESQGFRFEVTNEQPYTITATQIATGETDTFTENQ